MAKAKMYFTLITLENGKWSAQFGDYNKDVVEQEIEDSYADLKKSERKIIRTVDAQEAINDKIRSMNPLETVEQPMTVGSEVTTLITNLQNAERALSDYNRHTSAMTLIQLSKAYAVAYEKLSNKISNIHTCLTTEELCDRAEKFAITNDYLYGMDKEIVDFLFANFYCYQIIGLFADFKKQTNYFKNDQEWACRCFRSNIALYRGKKYDDKVGQYLFDFWSVNK